LTFEHLDPVDMSFDDSGVPGQSQASDGSVAVRVDACGERVEAGKVVFANGVEPGSWSPARSTSPGH
jgi:hypothetical protein